MGHAVGIPAGPKGVYSGVSPAIGASAALSVTVTFDGTALPAMGSDGRAYAFAYKGPAYLRPGERVRCGFSLASADLSAFRVARCGFALTDRTGLPVDGALTSPQVDSTGEAAKHPVTALLDTTGLRGHYLLSAAVVTGDGSPQTRRAEAVLYVG